MPIGATRTSVGAFTVRVLTGSEGEACEAFVRRLARDDIRMRFGSPRCSIQSLLPSWTAPSHNVAFGAVTAAGEILGIANLPRLAAGAAELGLIVRSDYKRRGVGRALIAEAVRWAAGHGVSHIVGIILAENRPMLALAEAAGFRASRCVQPWIDVYLDVATERAAQRPQPTSAD